MFIWVLWKEVKKNCAQKCTQFFFNAQTNIFLLKIYSLRFIPPHLQFLYKFEKCEIMYGFVRPVPYILTCFTDMWNYATWLVVICWDVVGIYKKKKRDAVGILRDIITFVSKLLEATIMSGRSTAQHIWSTLITREDEHINFSLWNMVNDLTYWTHRFKDTDRNTGVMSWHIGYQISGDIRRYVVKSEKIIEFFS